MGSTIFQESNWIPQQKGHKYNKSIVLKAFNNAVKKAEKYYGHQEGYSGEINAKDDFCIGGVMTRKQFDKVFQSWYNDDDRKLKKIVDNLNDADYSCLMSCKYKYDDACAVILKDVKDILIENVPKTISFEKITPEKPIKLEFTGKNDWKHFESFDTATEAKKRAREVHGKGWKINKLVKESYSYKIDQDYRDKEVKAVEVKFFGYAPS